MSTKKEKCCELDKGEDGNLYHRPDCRLVTIPIQSESIEWKQAFRLWAFHEEDEKVALTGAQSIHIERYFEKVIQEAITTAVAKDRDDCPCVKFKLEHPGNVKCRRCDIEKVVQKAVLNKIESEVNIAVAKDRESEFRKVALYDNITAHVDNVLAAREKELVEEVEKIRRLNKEAKPADKEEEIDERAYDAACRDILSILKH